MAQILSYHIGSVAADTVGMMDQNDISVIVFCKLEE